MAEDGNRINARPTKRLVAYVITKDIQLEDAILDLIDNSIDGARRSKTSLKKFRIDVTFDANHFQIKDNCGGISRELAKNYAFRFGRPEDYAPGLDEALPHGIGNFGIGMKRALLKMGKHIEVSSRTKTDYFQVVIPVEKWMQDDSSPDAWTFEFAKQGSATTPIEQTGTTIKVTALYAGVADRFALAEFDTSLRLRVKNKESEPLSQGVNVLINGHAVETVEPQLLQSTAIKPIFKSANVGPVRVRLYAGVDQRNNDAAGWTVVCNGRTILRADKTPATGWGYEEDGDKIPAYHHQYAMFRGYLFFDADDANRLPWNTTKTGLDVEHPLYRRYRLEMIAAMKEVFAFLKDLDKEKDVEDTPLQDKIAKANAVSLKMVKSSAVFVRPGKGDRQPESKTLTWIRYQRKTPEVRQVMSSLDVTTAAEAGDRTFELYLNTAVKGRK